MDTAFWVTIGIDAVVAFVVGILGAAIAPAASAKLVNFLYARRVARSLKQKQIELRDYERIKAFHLGTKDKHFYYVYLGTFSIASFIASATCMIVAVVVGASYTDERFIIGALSGFIFGLLGILILIGMQSTANNLEDFDEYEKRIKERWSDA
jgi:hypothetical protein